MFRLVVELSRKLGTTQTHHLTTHHLTSSMRIEYHRTLLADRVRNAALHAALARLVVKGETTVADIGAGTGFLGFLAARLGARRVDLYEAAGVASVARKLLRQNRLRNCRLFEMHSTEAVDPDRVDLIVCETLGNYALEENIVETLNDARARFLKPGGKIVPAAIRQFVCPVVSGRFLTELSAWDSVGYGLDLGPAKTMSLNNIYVRTFEAGELLEGAAAVRMWDGLAFDRHNKTTRAGEASWTLGERNDGLRPGALVEGRPRRGHCPVHRPARRPHPLGAALPAGAGAACDRGRAHALRPRALHHLLRARHQRRLDARREGRRRPPAHQPVARSGEGVSAIGGRQSGRARLLPGSVSPGR